MGENESAHRRIFMGSLAACALIWSVAWVVGGARAADPPRVVAGWAAGLFEARVAFDGAVDAGLAERVVGTSIAFDAARPYVGARATPMPDATDHRGALRVTAARLEDGGRTLVLTTDPHPRPGTYSLVLPFPGRDVPVDYDLTGVEASWSASADVPPAAPAVWWPSLDPGSARKEAARILALGPSLGWLERPGRLTLACWVGPPSGSTELRLSGRGLLEANLGGEEPAPRKEDEPAVFRVEPTGEPALLTVVLATGAGGSPSLQVATPGESDAKPVTLARGAMIVPWAPLPPVATAAEEVLPNLEGGDPARGAVVFASAEARCASCHKFRGQGGEVGPDLSILAGRDKAAVYRDIAAPSRRIHPDYVPFTLALHDGRILAGTVRSRGTDSVSLTDTETKTTVLKRAEVAEFRPSATSIMPVGLAGVIGEARMRDLIAYLTAPAPTNRRVEADWPDPTLEFRARTLDPPVSMPARFAKGRHHDP